MLSSATDQFSSMREPPATDPMRRSLEELTARIDEALVAGGVHAVPVDVIQRMCTLGVKLYAARRAAGGELSPCAEGALNATEVAVATSGMLEAVQLDLFELSLWRQWGRP